MPAILESVGGIGELLHNSPNAATGHRPTPGEGDVPAIREVVLLSGSVRADRFHEAAGRSVLDLPLDAHRTLVDDWAMQSRGLAAGLGFSSLSVRVMLDQAAPMPAIPQEQTGVRFQVERDPYAYRGTGGVLRDLAQAYYDDEDYLVVANGAQRMSGSLTDHVRRLARAGGDVALVAHADGTPTGLMLVSCRVLRLVSPTGFVDFKEQALPMIAATHDVRVVRYDEPTGWPVRTLPDYLAALRAYHQPAAADPFAEELRSAFQVVERGALVEEGALLHDSVVLSGATVERDAVVVRSLVCPGARVRRGQRLIDRLVTGNQAGSTEDEEP